MGNEHIQYSSSDWHVFPTCKLWCSYYFCLFLFLQEFEDLDEIIARYIQPMAAFARDILNYKYYMEADGGKKEITDKFLVDEKKKAPSK